MRLDIFNEHRSFFTVYGKIDNPCFAGLFKNFVKLTCFNLDMDCFDLMPKNMRRNYPFEPKSFNTSSQNRSFLRR